MAKYKIRPYVTIFVGRGFIPRRWVWVCGENPRRGFTAAYKMPPYGTVGYEMPAGKYDGTENALTLYKYK